MATKVKTHIRQTRSEIDMASRTVVNALWDYVMVNALDKALSEQDFKKGDDYGN